MNTTYMLVFRSETTPRKVILSEADQTITATFFYSYRYLAHKGIDIEQFPNTLEVIKKWLGGNIRVTSSQLGYACPIIRWG